MSEIIDGHGLTVEALARIAAGADATLDPEARARMAAHARLAAEHGANDIVRRKWTWIGGGRSPESAARVFVEGHCAAVGEPMPREEVRALLAARANVLARGPSGCRPEVVDLLLEMLRRDIVPVIPAQGSTGAAGCPALAHLVRVACGWGGEAWREGRRLPAAEAMRGLPTLEPNEKEALSLINGATLSAARAALACSRARTVLRAAEAACALSFEVVRADLACLSPRALEARNHPGVVAVGARLRALLEGSELVVEGREPDAFSVRCAPLVLGTAHDALASSCSVVERELNAAVDNPLVFDDVGLVEAGNFHGAPVALAADHLKLALTQVASIAERRIYRLTYGRLSGLPSFLLPDSGVNSGLMLAQYTAASLVSECKQLSHPASVDSIPTVQHHEDHVSMGAVAAASALRVVDLVADVVAIELLCAAQGLDFRIEGERIEDGVLTLGPGANPGRGTAAVHRLVRERVPRWIDDRVLHPDLAALGRAVREGVFDLPAT